MTRLFRRMRRPVQGLYVYPECEECPADFVITGNAAGLSTVPSVEVVMASSEDLGVFILLWFVG